MSSVHGSRVREPRIVGRPLGPSDKRSSSWKDLAQAWASLGEAKSVLQKLDELSPPNKKKAPSRPTLRNHTHRPTGTVAVHFANGVDEGRRRGRLHASTYKPAEGLQSSRIPKVHWEEIGVVTTRAGGHLSPPFEPMSGYSTEDSENVVEGTVLNSTPGQPLRRNEQGGIHPRPATAPTASSPPPSLPSVHVSCSHPLTHPSTAPLQYSPASNPNVIALSPSRSHHTHSNARAVFSPAVSFGDLRHSQPPAHSENVTTRGTARIEFEPRRPLTRKTFTSAPPPSFSTHPPLSAGVTQPSIRKFELPAETLDSLRSKVEQQRLAVEATGSRVGTFKPRTTVFQPPPGATTSLASSSTPHGPPLPSELAPPSGRPHPTHERRKEEGVTKRRKVASVPPPPTYTGFSSVNLRVDGESLHWRPNLEKTGRPLPGPPPKPSGDGVPSKTNKPPMNVAPERVRKVRRIAAVANTEGRSQHMATWKPESDLITPSSWRSGRELADRILRQEGHGTPAAATGATPEEALSVSDLREEEESNRSETPVELLAAKEEPRTNGTGLSHAARILEDLRMSPVDDHAGGHSPKRSISAPASSAPKKPRYNFEPVYPTERVRHYEQGKVQQYMFRKREDRRRKEVEERATQDQARREREERLQTLYSQQRRRLEANLRHQQKQRETYSQALASAPVHVHIHDSASSEDIPVEEHDAELLTVTSSHSHPLTSPRVSSTGGVATRSASSTHSSPRQRTQLPSPPHQLRVPEGSPPRYSALQPPRAVSADRTHTASPEFRHVLETHSPLSSPRTYSVHHSPPTHAPSPRRELVPSPPTHPPPAHTHLSPGRAKRLHPSSSSPQVPGELASLLRASQGESRSREERIQALTLSALRLKERIAMESKRLTDSKEPSQSFEEPARPRSSPPEARTRSTDDHTPCHTPTPPVTLPGVQSIHQHALQAERARREAEAALKIQGAYRGFRVRKSLQWQLPSGGTLGGGRMGDGAETESERGGAQSEEEVEEVIELEPSSAAPSVSEPQRVTPTLPVSQSSLVLPVSAPPPPWEQTGGDVHSVINVFARRHELLRAKLAEMKTQKLAELQEIKEQSASVRTSSAEQPESSVTARISQRPLSQSYSYSQMFEEPSTKDQEDAGSQVSEQFSEDSLVPPAHSSPIQVSPHTIPPPSHTGTLPDTGSQGPSVITPPGSPSFVDTFSDHTQLEPTVPKTERPHPSPPRPQDGRLSPRSLEVKLHAELNLLESVEESMRQLSALENTRAVSLAQQESVSLAQVMKSRQLSHEREMDQLASKAKRDVEEASSQFKRVHDEAVIASEQVRRLREEADARSREQAGQLAKLHQESVVAAQEATRQLLEARTKATSAVIGAAQQQLQAAHDVAISAASAAAKQAVKSALKVVGRGGEVSMATTQDESQRTDTSPSAVPTYQSDFEPSTVQPDSLAEEEEEEDKDVSTDLEGQSTPIADHSGDKNSSIEESLTPVISDGHLSAEADGAVVEGEGRRGHGLSPPPRTPSPEEEIEESIDEEASFRELLPSESHRRRRIHYHHSTDSESRCSTPSRPQTPTTARGRDGTSPANTEDSFFRFMDKMVRQYMREEELRARHQANLLELREKAVREKTQAELEWLRLKKKQIRSKGEDDLMPPLVQREKGLLMRLQEEQAEIRHLQEVQRNASHERKIMFMQQREISKIRRSAQYYRQKIHRYRSQEGSGREDHLSMTSDREASPAPSVEGSQRYSSDHSISEDLSKTHEQEEVRDSEDATPVVATQTPTMPTYTPSPHPSSKEPRSSSLRKLRDQRSDDTLGTPATDSTTVHRLQEIASGRNAERQLARRWKRLARRRHIAETALQKKQELMAKERQLDREEQQVNKLISTLEEDKQSVSKDRSGQNRRKKVSEKTQADTPETAFTSQYTGTRSPPPPQSVPEELQSSDSIPEEVPSEDGKEPSQTEVSPSSHLPTVPTAIPTEYGSDTFESLETTLTHPPSHPHVMSSTPIQPQVPSHDTPSPSESLKITSSVSESIGTATSDGSVIEARIRQLKAQLQARKEEARRIQSEQRRKKKDLLRQQEDDLKRKLEAVETVISKTKRTSPSPPPPLEIFSLSSSSAATSQAESPGMSSEEGDRSPHPVSPPYQLGSRDAVDTTLDRPVSSSEKMEADSIKPLPLPLSDQKSASEVPTQLSDSHPPIGEEFSYTEFSEPLPSAGEGRGKDSSVTEAARSVSEALEQMVESLQSAPQGVEPKSPTPEPHEELEKVTPTSSVHENLIPEEEEQVDLVKEEEDGEGFIGREELDGERHKEMREGEELMKGDGEPKTGEDTRQPPTEGSYSETFEAPSESTALTEEGPTAGQIHDYLTPPSSVQNDADISTGQRVLIGNVMAGTVKFVGHTHFAEGLWIGVELDMPKGRNDGSLDDHRYFHCEPNHGLFAPPGKVSLFDEEEAGEGEREEGESYEEGSVAEEIDSSYSSSHDGSPPGEGEGELKEEAQLPGVEPVEKRMPHAGPVHATYVKEFESEHRQPSTAQDSLLPSHPEPEEEPVTKHEEQDLEGNVGDVDKEVVEEVSEELTEPESSGAEEGLEWGDATPPPPPEFAGGSLPSDTPLQPSPAKEGSVSPTIPAHHPAVNTIANDLVQELSNEAYETIHHLWRSKKTVVPPSKDIPLALDDKADRMADELLVMLLQSETDLVCNIRSARKSLESYPPPSTVMSKPRLPLTISIPLTPIIECSPPPLSPPSPYRTSPPPSDHSPPGSPPRHLSQVSQARVVAGDKTPFPAVHQDAGTPTVPRNGPVAMERSVSVESISRLLESIKLTTAQCMVPSERDQVNRVVEYAWNAARDKGTDLILTADLECPQEVLSLFADQRELNQEEEHCRVAYLQLVYDLSLEVIRDLHRTAMPRSAKSRRCSVGPQVKNREDVTMEVVQRKVYAALMRGQLPPQLPSVKFLYRMKRPGGREIDFVDAILIKELREEEPSWVEYGEDEEQVKLRAADAILDQLLSEAVQILCKVGRKHSKS